MVFLSVDKSTRKLKYFVLTLVLFNLTGNSSIFTHTVDVNRPAGEEGTMITFDILETKVWFWVIPIVLNS